MVPNVISGRSRAACIDSTAAENSAGVAAGAGSEDAPLSAALIETGAEEVSECFTAIKAIADPADSRGGAPLTE